VVGDEPRRPPPAPVRACQSWTDAGIPPRSYARIGTADLTWSELSAANRRRAGQDPSPTRDLVRAAIDQAAELSKVLRALHRELDVALEEGQRRRHADERLRDRGEDALAGLVLTVDLLAERWNMDLPRALAQRFNEQGVRDHLPERLNPRSAGRR
jgi:hypothetical protein